MQSTFFRTCFIDAVVPYSVIQLWRGSIETIGTILMDRPPQLDNQKIITH